MRRQTASATAAVTAGIGASEALHPQRPMPRNEQLVYAALVAAGAPLKAYALLERLYDDGIRAPMTIYRALDGLIERGLARKVASLNAFVALTAESKVSLGAFVTCNQCGQTRSVGIQNAVVERLLAPAGMSLSDIYIEAFGNCDRIGCGDADRRTK